MEFCPHCGKSLEAVNGAAFCPFCGGAVETQSKAQPEPEEAKALLTKLQGEPDVRKKHAGLLEAQQRFPESLAIAQELLHMGRLYERGSRQLDFSIIKCYVLMPFLKPQELPRQRREELVEEIFRHPQLEKCLALSGDPEGFTWRYLLRLNREFIELFLRGDSRYMRRIFGIGLDSQAPKYLAGPVACMLQTIRKEDSLEPQQRDMLMRALYQAFAENMTGNTEHLDKHLREMGIPTPV